MLSSLPKHFVYQIILHCSATSPISQSSTASTFDAPSQSSSTVASQTEQSSGHKVSVGTIVGPVVAAVVALLAALFFVLRWRYNRRERMLLEPIIEQVIAPFPPPGHSVEAWEIEPAANPGGIGLGNVSQTAFGVPPVMEKHRHEYTGSATTGGPVGVPVTTAHGVGTEAGPSASTTFTPAQPATPQPSQMDAQATLQPRYQPVDVDHIIELIAQRIDRGPRFTGEDDMSPPPSYPAS